MSLAAMESVIRTNEDAEDSKVFLYVVMPKSDEAEEGIDSDSNSWRGKTHYTINLMKSLFATSNSQVQQMEKKMNEQILATREQVMKQTDAMQKQMAQMNARFDALNFEQMQADLKTLLSRQQ